jgi:nitrite reductase/ring-hydroxylating ferredoxin subunit
MAAAVQDSSGNASPYPLCRFDELADRSATGIELRGVNGTGAIETCPLVLVRWDGQVFGYINTCPHTPVRLDGRSSGHFFNAERSHLMCEKHGALFEVDTGLCLDGPCEGKGLTPLSLEIVDGNVCLTNVRYVDAPPG